LQGCAEFGERTPSPRFYVNPPLKIAPKDSILISVRAPVGTLNLADQKYGIGRGLAAIVGPTANGHFLRYAIELNTHWLHRRSQGSTFLAIGSDDLRKLPIRISREPSACQLAANVILALEAQIEATEALIAKQERVRAGLLQDLFTRGVDEHGALRSPREEAPHLYHQTKLGWMPKKWAVNKLDYLVRIIDCKHYTPKYTLEGYPVLRPRNIKSDGLDFVNVDYVCKRDYDAMTDVYRPKRGDVIFSRNASFGVACRVESDVEFAIGQDVIIMAPKYYALGYIFYCL
jgi:type I restriction enzyme, S subunit